MSAAMQEYRGVNLDGAVGSPLSVKPFQSVAVVPLEVRDLPSKSGIKIEHDTPNRLVFSLPLLPPGMLRTGVSVGMLLFGLIWLGISGSELVRGLQRPIQQPEDWAFLAFSMLPMIPGLLLLGLGLSIARGRIRVELDEDRFQVRYGIGLIGKRKRFETSSIDTVTLRSGLELEDRKRPRLRSRQRRQTVGGGGLTVAVVHSGNRFLPITTLHERKVAEAAAGLVKQRLDELGFPLQG